MLHTTSKEENRKKNEVNETCYYNYGTILDMFTIFDV